MTVSQAHSEAGLKERFYRDFQQEVTTLQKQIDDLNSTSATGSERSIALDQCLAGIDRLSHEVKDASSYIPAYDQRSYSLTIKGLSEKLQTTRNSFNPPKKFSFKARRTAPAPEQNQSLKPHAQIGSEVHSSERLPAGKEKNVHEAEEDVADGIPDGPGVRRPSLSHATKVIITKHAGLYLKLPATASHATSSGTISNLQRCVIDLSAPTTTAPFSALYLKNIKDSLVICGQTAGAVHITDVENSVLVISCRQFRMHGSKKVDVYLHSASRPIIEDCVGIRFAPMPHALESLAIAQAVNHWNQIDDFKWLKAEASPNFSLIDEARRIKDEVWREKVLESEDLGEVLRVVRVE